MSGHGPIVFNFSETDPYYFEHLFLTNLGPARDFMDWKKVERCPCKECKSQEPPLLVSAFFVQELKQAQERSPKSAKGTDSQQSFFSTTPRVRMAAGGDTNIKFMADILSMFYPFIGTDSRSGWEENVRQLFTWYVFSLFCHQIIIVFSSSGGRMKYWPRRKFERRNIGGGCLRSIVKSYME